MVKDNINKVLVSSLDIGEKYKIYSCTNVSPTLGLVATGITIYIFGKK